MRRLVIIRLLSMNIWMNIGYMRIFTEYLDKYLDDYLDDYLDEHLDE